MELIRQALGVEKISYYGFSYGTYLGAGLRDPLPDARWPVRPRRRGQPAARLVLRQLRPGPCLRPQHGRVLAVRRQPPGRLPPRQELASRQARATTASCDCSTASRPRAAGSVPTSWPTRCSTPATTSTTGSSSGHAYSDLVRKRRGGALADLYRDGNMGDDNGFAIYNAVQCSDVPWPGWQRTRARSWSVHRRAPFLTWANTWYNAPCLSWKAPSHRRLAVSGSALTSKVLMISETRDAATPYAGALAARRLLPDRLAGRRHRGHDARELALRGRLRRQRRGQLPAHRHRAAATGRQPLRTAAARDCSRRSRTAPGAGRRASRAATRLSPLLRQDAHAGPAAHLPLSRLSRGRCAARSSTRRPAGRRGPTRAARWPRR